MIICRKFVTDQLAHFYVWNSVNLHKLNADQINVKRKWDETLLVGPEFEKLSVPNCLIIFGIHLLALPAFYFFSWQAFGAFLFGHYLFGCIGATIGYHKLSSHKAFKGSEFVKNIIYTLATLCFQGGPIYWAAAHRVHHMYSDEYGDPHSASRGFFWSHIGWLLYKNPNGYSYTRARKSLTKDLNTPWVNFLEKFHLHLNLSFILLGALLFGVVLKRWDLFFWFFPMRIVLVWHCVWMINSYTHCAPRFMREKYGFRTINSILCSVLMYGEGYHDNHHKKPSSVCNIYEKPYLDLSFVTLYVMSLLGIVNFINDKSESPKKVA